MFLVILGYYEVLNTYIKGFFLHIMDDLSHFGCITLFYNNTSSLAKNYTIKI